jgi:hypothetical protein
MHKCSFCGDEFVDVKFGRDYLSIGAISPARVASCDACYSNVKAAVRRLDFAAEDLQRAENEYEAATDALEEILDGIEEFDPPEYDPPVDRLQLQLLGGKR